jgi:hypothetical protein
MRAPASIKNSDWYSFHLKNLSANTNAFAGVVWAQHRDMTEAAKSLIAQLDSQSKLATLRRENRKIWHENEMKKKQTNGYIKGRNLRSIEWYQKTYVYILWGYPINLFNDQRF